MGLEGEHLTHTGGYFWLLGTGYWGILLVWCNWAAVQWTPIVTLYFEVFGGTENPKWWFKQPNVPVFYIYVRHPCFNVYSSTTLLTSRGSYWCDQPLSATLLYFTLPCPLYCRQYSAFGCGFNIWLLRAKGLQKNNSFPTIRICIIHTAASWNDEN